MDKCNVGRILFYVLENGFISMSALADPSVHVYIDCTLDLYMCHTSQVPISNAW